MNKGPGMGGGTGGMNKGPGMGGGGIGGGMGGQRIGGGNGMGGASMGGGLGGSGFMRPSSAATVNHALSSLSERAAPSRASRYGRSVQGSSPSSFDFSKGDRGSYWGSSYPRDKHLSLRDAGVKEHPNSVLGSIAASSQRQMKEIERYIYYEDDEYPSPRSSEFDDYDSSSGDDIHDSSIYPSQRSRSDAFSSNSPRRIGGYENDHYENEYRRLPPQRSSATERMHRHDDENDTRRLLPQRSSANVDRIDGDYGRYDRRMDSFDSDDDRDSYDDRDDGRPRRYDGRLDRFDGEYDRNRRRRRRSRSRFDSDYHHNNMRRRRMDRRPRRDQFDSDYSRENRRRRRRALSRKSELYDDRGYDYPQRRSGAGRVSDFDPEFDPMYDDPYTEPY